MRGIWVFLAAMLLVACGGGGAPNPTPSPLPPSPLPRATRTPNARLQPGNTDSIRSGNTNLRITIVSFGDAPPCVSGCAKAQPGKRFVHLVVIVENGGATTASIYAFEGDWKLRTSDGFEGKGETGFGTPDGPFKNSDLTPGGKEKGTISFYIAADTQVQWARYSPTNGIPGTTGPSVTFDAV